MQQFAEKRLGKLKRLGAVFPDDALVVGEEKRAANKARPITLPLFAFRIEYDSKNFDGGAIIRCAFASKRSCRIGH